jgi:hypothetical protein
MLQNPRGLVKCFKDFKLSKLPLFTSILSKVLLSCNLFSLFPPSTKNNHSSPPKEVIGTSFSKFKSKIMFENKTPNDLNSCR